MKWLLATWRSTDLKTSFCSRRRVRMACQLLSTQPKTLFYLDPPYWGSEGDYGQGVFDRPDFERLAEQLRTIRGRFILSINDRPEVREVFAGFEIEPVGLSYSLSSKGQTDAKELIISG